MNVNEDNNLNNIQKNTKGYSTIHLAEAKKAQ